MGKNQGFLSVNLSEARDNSTWAISWLAGLAVISLTSPSFPPPSHPCVRLKNLSVWVQNVPVCTGTTPACGNTCARGAGTHGDVLNLHNTRMFFLRAKPRHTPHHTHTQHHNTTRRQRQRDKRQRQTETERDRERRQKQRRDTERQRETEKERQDKTRKEKRRRDNKREETRR